jgi:hypothetical protein
MWLNRYLCTPHQQPTSFFSSAFVCSMMLLHVLRGPTSDATHAVAANHQAASGCVDSPPLSLAMCCALLGQHGALPHASRACGRRVGEERRQQPPIQCKIINSHREPRHPEQRHNKRQCCRNAMLELKLRDRKRACCAANEGVLRALPPSRVCPPSRARHLGGDAAT